MTTPVAAILLLSRTYAPNFTLGSITLQTIYRDPRLIKHTRLTHCAKVYLSKQTDVGPGPFTRLLLVFPTFHRIHYKYHPNSRAHSARMRPTNRIEYVIVPLDEPAHTLDAWCARFGALLDGRAGDEYLTLCAGASDGSELCVKSRGPDSEGRVVAGDAVFKWTPWQRAVFKYRRHWVTISVSR